MDPVSALGIASSIITFIDFAGSLISETNKIRQSPSGASPETLRLEAVYERLSECAAGLQVKASTSIESVAAANLRVAASDEGALNYLAEACKKDSDAILNVLRVSKVESEGNRAWKSVKAAFRERLGRDKVKEIEKRLESTQRTMFLCLMKILRETVSSLDTTIERTWRDNAQLQINQNSRLDHISRSMDTLRDGMSILSDKEALIIDGGDLTSFDRESLSELDHFLSADNIEERRSCLKYIVRRSTELEKERQFLSSLNFKARILRFEAIPSAHAKTFQWAFNSKLSHWLQHGSGIFWVSGKAGSGKSTLMKYLAQHTKTRQLLQAWSTPKPVVLASHYFWAAGASIQKSKTGLLRTLLYEIFRQFPSYIRTVYPSRWDQLIVESDWSSHELSDALQVLARQPDLPAKLCFFLDGLDEFCDDHTDLVAVLGGLATSPDIKLCVSSRPWNIFEDTLGQSPDQLLRVQDLTEKDIKVFALSMLESHSQWQLCSLMEEEKMAIIQDIRDRAQGVFLWVFLVTRSLRDGLTNGDTIRELKVRLNKLPTDLERLFKYILGQVDPLYHTQMAEILQIALHAREPLTLDAYAFQPQEYDDSAYAIHMPIKELSIASRLAIHDATRRRVNSRTNGLLESTKVTGHHHTVDFLHRTVRDFLLVKEMADYIESKSRPSFESHLSITRALVASTKSGRFVDGVRRAVCNPPSKNEGPLVEQLQEIFFYAANISGENKELGFDLLDELEYTITAMFKRKQATFVENLLTRDWKEPRLVFYEESLRSDLGEFVYWKRQRNPQYMISPGIIPLHIIMTADTLPIKTLQALLEAGENPDYVSNLPISYGKIASPWAHLCAQTSPWSLNNRRREIFNHMLNHRAHGIFLSHGADPNCLLPDSDVTVLSSFVLIPFLTDIDYIHDMDEYLQTLEDFFRADGSTRHDHNLPARASKTGPTLTMQLLDGVRTWRQRQNDESPRVRLHAKLLTDVIRRVLVHSKHPAEYVKGVIATSERIFSERIAVDASDEGHSTEGALQGLNIPLNVAGPQRTSSMRSRLPLRSKNGMA